MLTIRKKKISNKQPNLIPQGTEKKKKKKTRLVKFKFQNQKEMELVVMLASKLTKMLYLKIK